MTEPTREQIANVSNAIIARGLNIDTLSEVAGLQESLVREVLQGTIIPSYYVRLRLAIALNIDPSLIPSAE